MRTLILLLISSLVICGCGITNSIVDKPDPITQDSISTPEELELFMQQNIKYVNPTSEFQSPEKTLKDGGNCSDMAVFAASYLEKMGYHPQIVTVCGDNFAHVVCYFEEGFFSNCQYIKGKFTFQEMLVKVFSNWKVYAIYPDQNGVRRE